MNTRLSLAALPVCLAGALAARAAAPDKPQQSEVHRERIEWCDVWVPGGDLGKLPRVLLVGDSITRGYYAVANEKLKDKAYVTRFTTSAFLGDRMYLKQMDSLLDEYSFDVIHFNNGLHGWAYSEQEYEAALPRVVDHIRGKAPGAAIILVRSTPLRNGKDLSQLRRDNERVKARNRILDAFAAARGLKVNDLYGLVISHPDYHGQDGTHFNNEGRQAQGEQVAAVVLECLEDPARKRK